MADIDEALKSLHSKERLEKPPYRVVLHRFLASDKGFAPFAKVLNLEVTDDQLVLGIWQAAFPKAPGKPRLSYVGPRKASATEDHELAGLVAESYALSPEQARQAVEVCRLAGRSQDLAADLGYEGAGHSRKANRTSRKKGKSSPAKG